MEDIMEPIPVAQPVIPIAQPVQQQVPLVPQQSAVGHFGNWINDAKEIFLSDHRQYIWGLAGGAAVAFVTEIVNPFAGALCGAPILPMIHFVDRQFAYLGNTLNARIARWALAFFASFLIGTLLTAISGFRVTLGQGALLLLALTVAGVAFVSLQGAR